MEITDVRIRKISEEGVTFKNTLNGDMLFLSPEKSIQIQNKIGADIIMSFDECIPYPADRRYAEQSMERTLRWAARGKAAHERPDEQALFGIVQGGDYEDLRLRCAEELVNMDFDGYAVGGLAVGETHAQMYDILDQTVPYLPVDKPTYLMGVGTPENIIESVDRGIDFFDCVYPSRNGRHGHVYTNHGKINLFNAKYELDQRPIEEGCGCPACRRYSRAYIRHLLKAKEMLGMRLCVLHNLYFYNTMMEEIRDAIDKGCYKEYKEQKLAGMAGKNIK